MKRLLYLMPILSAVAAYSQNANVLTQHNDPARTGANLQETILTPAAVKAGFGKLFSYPVDGQIYAQPLVVSGVDVPKKGMRNVVYVATMENNVYAFDADRYQDEPLWKANLGTPVWYRLIPFNWGSVLGQYNIKPFIGITSTPVIDPATHRMWVVAKTLEPPEDLHYHLHCIDIRTGAILATSPEIEKAGYGKDDALRAQTALQRPGLLLANEMVYLAFGSHQDGGHYHGWVLAFDASTLAKRHAFCATPNDSIDDSGEGGIWQAGNGPAADAEGNIYVMTGNGAWETNRQYGSSFVKLNPQLQVIDWFTPANYKRLNREDLDLGSSGPVLLPDSNQLVGGGKQGWFYLLSRDGLGKLQPKHSTAPALQEFRVSDHWSLTWISWLLPVFGYHHIHGGPVYWKSSQRGRLVYVWPEETRLKAYRYDPVTHFAKRPAAKGPKAPPGMPGGILSISANGETNGLLWATTPLKEDALASVVRGNFLVFDANTLEQLWSTEKNTPDDLFNFAKYCPPTIANGKVYLATFSGKLNVYGLLATPQPLPTWTTSGKPPKKGHGHGRMRM